MKRYAVVILNWNGASDTIACVESLERGDPEAVPIIIDNGSTDDSIPRIQKALKDATGHVAIGSLEELFSQGAVAAASAKAILVAGGANVGFAAGCNLGLSLAERLGFDVTVFLNNDTEAEPGALARIVERLREDASLFVTLPLITILGTSRIWNCGGTISSLGFRTYHFGGVERWGAAVPAELECTFFTGCCFAVRTGEFAARHGFTERFFFGEEDFELSLWMKDRRLRARCLTDAVVHHKVSASITRAGGDKQAPKVFVHYLNRFVHMRLRFRSVRWALWLAAYVPYVAILLLRTPIVPAREVPAFLMACIGRARRTSRVTKADFESILRVRPW